MNQTCHHPHSPLWYCSCFVEYLHLYLCHLCPFFLFLSCNSVRIHPLLLPYRMLPLLSLEQKGSGPSSPPLLPPPAPSHLLLCTRSPVLLCLTPDLHNRPFVEGMPTSSSVFSVLLCVCRETETKLRCFFSRPLTCDAFVHSGRYRECALCEECVWATVSQGFFNERVHVWEFVITHDSSVLWSPGGSRPGESRQPCVSLYFPANICSLKKKWANKRGSTELWPHFSSHPKCVNAFPKSWFFALICTYFPSDLPKLNQTSC